MTIYLESFYSRYTSLYGYMSESTMVWDSETLSAGKLFCREFHMELLIIFIKSSRQESPSEQVSIKWIWRQRAEPTQTMQTNRTVSCARNVIELLEWRQWAEFDSSHTFGRMNYSWNELEFVYCYEKNIY